MAAEAKPVKVAVVGSGLAGLTAGWLLSSEGSTAEVQVAAHPASHRRAPPRPSRSQRHRTPRGCISRTAWKT